MSKFMKLCYKNKIPIVFIAMLLYLLGLSISSIIYYERDVNAYNQKWKRQAKIDKYYQDKQCVKAGCEEVSIDCKEYCYDLATTPK